MKIGQYNSASMNNISSGTKKIGNVTLPDFNDFHFSTKTTPTMSDDKFRETIAEQAKKDQKAGKYYTQAVKNLQKQYVSVVSPDRKGFITEALMQMDKKPPSKNINYLHLFLFGEIKYEKGLEGLSYAEFKDNKGELIATYSNNGWTFFGTKAENARESEFFSIYREAWGNAAKSAKNATVTPNSVSVVSENSFDATV